MPGVALVDALSERVVVTRSIGTSWHLWTSVPSQATKGTNDLRDSAGPDVLRCVDDVRPARVRMSGSDKLVYWTNVEPN